jgi:hypothetical protein|tara:strand:+ start:19 stop:438 length:420 start_codon:yes stop_codon:yes gene_type:complete
MNTEKKDDMTIRIVGGIILGIFLLVFSGNSQSNSRYSLTDDELISIIEQTNKSFDLAEQEILKVNPGPDDEPSGPHPDADKCICGGTGKITHGDGHQTDCPYHGGIRPSLSKEEAGATIKKYVPRRRIFNFFKGIRIFN